MNSSIIINKCSSSSSNIVIIIIISKIDLIVREWHPLISIARILDSNLRIYSCSSNSNNSSMSNISISNSQIHRKWLVYLKISRLLKNLQAVVIVYNPAKTAINYYNHHLLHKLETLPITLTLKTSKLWTVTYHLSRGNNLQQVKVKQELPVLSQSTDYYSKLIATVKVTNTTKMVNSNNQMVSFQIPSIEVIMVPIAILINHQEKWGQALVKDLQLINNIPLISPLPNNPTYFNNSSNYKCLINNNSCNSNKLERVVNTLMSNKLLKLLWNNKMIVINLHPSCVRCLKMSIQN